MAMMASTNHFEVTAFLHHRMKLQCYYWHIWKL